MIVTFALATALAVDFGTETGKMRPELHSSGFGPTICSCPQKAIDDIRSMGFKAARTHDWALTNPGQRVCDYFMVFPLMNQDATKPENYCFEPTDYLLRRTREETGLDVFFRLGTSIEHSKGIHFNARIPEDFDKVAETFAGTVRHYNRGWANGFNWNIRYWEIWNEPDGVDNMWCKPGETLTGWGTEVRTKNMPSFIRLFVTCLKRLKSEFGDEIKVGGPALCNFFPEYFRPLLKACREAGVAPDFISWHYYSNDPDLMLKWVGDARALCDEMGFPKCELVVNEWHFFGKYGWDDLRSPDPEKRKLVWEGPHGHNGIDSSAFNLTVLSRFQSSKLDQAYYYGCKHVGSWGYKDEFMRKYNVYYSMKLFGDFIRDFPVLCSSTSEGTVTLLAGKSADGGKLGLLVTDYMGEGLDLSVRVTGVPAGAKARATVLDHERLLEPCAAEFGDGVLKLRKNRHESTAFCVTFERQAE